MLAELERFLSFLRLSESFPCNASDVMKLSRIPRAVISVFPTSSSAFGIPNSCIFYHNVKQAELKNHGRPLNTGI
jgi:hypothetical protein